MQTQTISSESNPRRGNVDDAHYSSYLARVQARFIERAKVSTLFETTASGLWEAYLSHFPEETRQFHNCNACRRFIEAFGGLVVIAEDGTQESALWERVDVDYSVPGEYEAIDAMIRIVRRAVVRGPFLSAATVLGHPETGIWRHLALALPTELVYRGTVMTAGQQMAEKRQDFLNVVRALDEYPSGAVLNAVSLLKSDALYRSEKVLGPAQFLADLHAAVAAHPHRRQNVIWRAVGAAPAGFCHPRSSMVGTLLDDIVAGVSFEVASRKFREKMDPEQYQRPQAPPKAGNLAVAEKRFAELGLAPSLKRRFARLEEVQTIWLAEQPKAPPAAGGVFSHLKPRGALEQALEADARMTWEKFARLVLPTAAGIEVLVPHVGDFIALVTAEDPDAPPIIRWDYPEHRNPVSWYVYPRGSAASQWGLRPGAWVPVDAIALLPWMWGDSGFTNYEPAAVLVVRGAQDSHGPRSGGALFPEILRTDLRDVYPTIEAYSKTASLSGIEQASASGLRIVKDAETTVRVRDRVGATSQVLIDRWD